MTVPLLFVGLGLSLLDPDEGLYADIARRMLVTGDWVLPHYNGLPYLEKPPLYFWLAAGALGLGDGEWALRACSALAALGTVLLARAMARRLYGPEAGLLAALALATTAGYALYVRKASTDFLFVLCLTLAMYGFLRDAERPEAGRRRFLLFYLGAALGVLAKGLIGAVFPAVVVALGLAWSRRLALRDLNLLRGGALFAAVAVPWHLAVAVRDPELFWFYLVDNQILRFLGLRGVVEDDVPVTTAGFLVVTFLWLFPWGAFALARPPSAALPGARWQPVVVSWALVVIVFFALSRSTLEYYALPAFPAVAILVGGAWASGRDIGRWLTLGVAGSAVVGGLAVWSGARLTPDQALAGLSELNVYYRILREQGSPFPYGSAQPFGILLQGLGVALIVGWGVAALCWVRGRRRAAFGALVALGAVIGILIVQLLHLVEPHHSAKAVAQALVAQARAGDVIVHEGPLEYSAALPYYTGRRIAVVYGARGDLELASRRPEARAYFLDMAGLAALWQGPARVFVVTQRPPGQGVVSGLPHDRVHVIGRFGSRALYSNRAGEAG